MSTPLDVLTIIEAFANRYQTGQFGWHAFTSFIDRYLMEHPELESKYDDLHRLGNKTLLAHIEALEMAGDVRLAKQDTTIQNIFYPSWVLNRLTDAYSKLDEKPELPFPTENSLEISIPPDSLKIVDIKTEFIAWLSREPSAPVFLRINFPEGIQSLLTASNLLENRMVLAAVQKIRHYLRDSKNMAYVRQRLVPAFRSREIAIKDMLHGIVTSPDQSAQTILEPTDFTFQLWTQLSTNIVKEYAAKTDKMAEEHAFCQAAYLIGYYNMNYRGKIQKRKEAETALTLLIQNLRKPPYAYHITQMHEFTDEKGVLLIKRIDKNRINSFIQERVETQPGKDHPDILNFKTHSGDDFFILYTSVAQFLSEMLIRAQREMRDFYKRSWMLALRNDVEFTTMYADEPFRQHLDQRMRRHFPQLQAILTFQIVFFASRIEGLPAQARADLNEIIISSAQRLKSIEAILKLNRKKMLEDAKILLPAWMVIPGVKQIARFFRQIFLGKDMAQAAYSSGFDHEGQELLVHGAKPEAKKTEPSGADSAARQQQQAAFRQAAKLLESEFIDDDETLQPTLQSLVDRWNQTLDARARANLVTDVNNLCKDYLRKQRAFSRQMPPDAATLRVYANKLIEGEHLRAIRNKKDLYRYICLYFVHVLQAV